MQITFYSKRFKIRDELSVVAKVNYCHSLLLHSLYMQPEISICIPVIKGQFLEEALNSIFANKFQDFEVVVNDSSDSLRVKEILSKYDVKIIEKMTKSFESRLITVQSSKGYKVFLSDETRILGDTMLKEIASTNNDMIVIREIDVGGGLLNFFSNLDKKNAHRSATGLDPLNNKSVIPRVYKRNIIDESFNRIGKRLSSEIMMKIVGLDLELIYLESFNQSQDIGIIESPEIMHYGDANLRALYKKYYRYGRSQKKLRHTAYSEFADLSGRSRTGLPLWGRLQSLPIQFIRGIPFVIGYLSG